MGDQKIFKTHMTPFWASPPGGSPRGGTGGGSHVARRRTRARSELVGSPMCGRHRRDGELVGGHQRLVGSRPQVVERCAARGGRKWWLPSAESGAKLRSGQCPRRRRRRDEGRGECRMDEDGADRGIRHGGQTDNTTDGHAQGVHQPCGKPLYVAPTCELGQPLELASRGLVPLGGGSGTPNLGTC